MFPNLAWPAGSSSQLEAVAASSAADTLVCTMADSDGGDLAVELRNDGKIYWSDGDVWIKQLDEAEKKFKDQVAEKQKELDDEVQKIRDRKTLDETTRSRLMRMAEERKNEELRQVNEEIEQTKQRDMRQIRNETERAIRSIEGTYKWAGILLPPLPAILLGILFLVMRLKTETSNIPSDRSRS